MISQHDGRNFVVSFTGSRIPGPEAEFPDVLEKNLTITEAEFPLVML